MKTMQSAIQKNKFVFWYAACFLLLGIIDQRRGSANGDIQLMFANLVGTAAFGMLLPSMKRDFFASTLFRVCVLIGTFLGIAACFLGKALWPYWGQWNTAVLNCAWIAIAVTYFIWNRKNISISGNQKKSLILLFILICLLMLFSARKALWQLPYLVLFGGLYFIGIPESRKDDFLKGMLGGLAFWFLIQQVCAYAFRPYDYVRYRGMYTGETQNALFYMIVFCAFTGLWLWLRINNRSRFWRIAFFLLSAFSLSLMLLTGGRSGLMGAAAACIYAYLAYDLIIKKSFRHWVLQGIVLAVCIILLFPVAYGTVRVFPTVLHHPIWFSADYQEDNRSVLSYDPADSEKYISFSEAMQSSVGRILQMVGINLTLDDEGRWHISTPFSMKSDAAEYEEPGSNIDNPYISPNPEWEYFGNSVDARKLIYSYYLTHLNLFGHGVEKSGFWAEKDIYYSHAHNVFLQVAYDYGVITGALFLGFHLWILWRLIRRRDMPGIIGAMFLIAILTFGLSEMVITTGQISLSLLFVIYYWGIDVPDNLADTGRRCK